MSNEPFYNPVMPLHLDSFNHSFPDSFNTDLTLEGLESFSNNLEKFFFSKVTVRNFASNNLEVNLAIELKCNLRLVEMLFHFNKGTWGNFSQGTPLIKLLEKLNDENHLQIDIEELSIFFNDTSIIINKIYKKSIPEQLETIFSEMGKHYVHLSKGLAETPYEVYIPVFEECNNEKDILLRNIEAGNHTKKDYLKYWGIYFESEDDAVIYDLRKSQLENGDLFMLNHS